MSNPTVHGIKINSKELFKALLSDANKPQSKEITKIFDLCDKAAAKLSSDNVFPGCSMFSIISAAAAYDGSADLATLLNSGVLTPKLSERIGISYFMFDID